MLAKTPLLHIFRDLKLWRWERSLYPFPPAVGKKVDKTRDLLATNRDAKTQGAKHQCEENIHMIQLIYSYFGADIFSSRFGGAEGAVGAGHERAALAVSGELIVSPNGPLFVGGSFQV